jgi:hypothetical protein
MSAHSNPADSFDWQEFCEFVNRELGDIPVLDGTKFISPKINNYWRLWRYATDRILSRTPQE